MTKKMAVILLVFLSSRLYSGEMEGVPGIDLSGVYTVNLEICVNTSNQPEGKPITSGYPDYKPSWSPDGSRLLYIARPAVRAGVLHQAAPHIRGVERAIDIKKCAYH